MNTRLIITTTAVICLGLAGWVDASVVLKTAQDAYIDGLLPDSNFGTATLLYTSQTTHGTRGGAKVYLRFDASALANAVTRIESLSIYRQDTNTTVLPQNLYLIATADDTDVVWTETGITWNNAPANAAYIGTTNRNFAAGTGEKIIFLGQLQNSGGRGWKTLTLQAGSVAETALLRALNTGSRTVTIGMSWAASNTLQRSWRSRENGSGAASAPYLYVQTGDNYCADPPQFDLTGDCRVNLADLARVAFDWMECRRDPASACLEVM